MKVLWEVVQWIIVLAFFGGGVGFVVGFIGPLIFYPGSNQGPLLSIFTVPIGVIVGTVVGMVFGIWQLRKKNYAKKRVS